MYDVIPYSLYKAYAEIIPIIDFPDPVGASSTVCFVPFFTFSTIDFIVSS